MKAIERLQAVQDSEINFFISCFYDNQWTAKIGDIQNGFISEGNFDTLESAAEWIVDTAANYFGESKFSRYLKEKEPVFYLGCVIREGGRINFEKEKEIMEGDHGRMTPVYDPDSKVTGIPDVLSDPLDTIIKKLYPVSHRALNLEIGQEYWENQVCLILGEKVNLKKGK